MQVPLLLLSNGTYICIVYKWVKIAPKPGFSKQVFSYNVSRQALNMLIISNFTFFHCVSFQFRNILLFIKKIHTFVQIFWKLSAADLFCMWEKDETTVQMASYKARNIYIHINQLFAVVMQLPKQDNQIFLIVEVL